VKPRILVVGSANVDFVQRISRVPLTGETVISPHGYSFIPGGKGANSAVAAARLGAEVIFCARLGADNYGVELRKVYLEDNIDVRYIKLDKTIQTGLASILVEKDGSNRIIAFPGANELLSAGDVEEAFTAYPDALLTQFEINPSVVVSAVSQAESIGVPVFIDGGPARKDFPFSALAKVEVFSPNETETFAYTGVKPINMNTCLHAAMKLHNSMNVKYIVLKLGDRGAYIYDGKYCEFLQPYPVIAVDTTAAGDAFTAALTYQYLESKGDIKLACKYANAVGALTVTAKGAITSLPSAKELEDFIRKENIKF
jgi:Sugar kinases, ribokinase family